MDRLRVFIAVDIEEPLVVSAMERVKEALVATRVPMKPVEAQNLHITLRFIGEVPRGVVEEIARSVLARLEFEEFEVEFRGLGAFPSPLRPRVVWVGVSEGQEQLARLHESIEEGLRRLGIPPERERFVPHVTLARLRGSRNLTALVKLLQEYEDYVFGRMRVTSVRLKKSTLTPKGPIYENLWEVKAR
ncbi:RNA 2',3'-cyclic phosphodiesterase [Stetteria hydrogenophila]